MDSDFGLVEPFDIDDGQLDGNTPQENFVLGYELADISMRAEWDPDGFNKPIHADNKDRIEKALKKRGRMFRCTWPTDDRSEQWLDLSVAPMD